MTKQSGRQQTEFQQLSFGIENVGRGGQRFVSFLPGENGNIVIYRETRRFVPKVGKPYECEVTFREATGPRGKFLVGYASPVKLEFLTDQEWIPLQSIREHLVVKLTFFDEGKGRLVAKDDGQIVLPAPGKRVVVGKEASYLLQEKGNVSFAHLLTEIEQSSETALVHLASNIGLITSEDLKVVVLEKVNQLGPNTFQKFNIYEALSYVDDKNRKRVHITAESTAEDIKLAFRAMIKVVSPDTIGARVGGYDKLPERLLKASENYSRMLTQAKDNALKLLERNSKDRARPTNDGTTSKNVSTAESRAAVTTPVAPAPAVTPAKPTVQEFLGIPNTVALPTVEMSAAATAPIVIGTIELNALAANECNKSVEEFSKLSPHVRRIYLETFKKKLLKRNPATTFVG